MITDSPDRFLRAFAELPPAAPACALGAFLVSPSAPALATESARDNAYMDPGMRLDLDRARAQHAALAEALAADVPVTVFPGHPDAPDGMFPNNVFATTAENLIVGRMRHDIRRAEAGHAAIRQHFADSGRGLVDLSLRDDLVAELTGSLIIDRARGIGYAGLSERCDEAGARAMHDAFGLNLSFCFELAKTEYHTNVVMALLASRAVILAADGFADSAVPRAIASACEERVIWIDPSQKQAFAGNAISLSEQRVWMSARAASALHDGQRKKLGDWGFALSCVELGELEKAGGSLRCCIAEIF
ncbi:MAG: arginine deiminase-related protein [Rhodanobacteraceae bacterium]